MKIGNREFANRHKTYVMGILNVTPDSFSDGGKWRDADSMLFRAQEMIKEGADILDVGGESTRPGAVPVSAEEEISRILPVIQKLKQEFDIPLSLDTYKAAVAKAGLMQGVDMINDIWGLKGDTDMAAVIAQSGKPCCLMHNRKEAVYQNLIEEIACDFAESLHLAELAGIAEENIILDPGIGFAKSYEENLQVLQALDSLASLGYPLLLGASRKSVIGQTLNLPVEERLEGTLATTVLAVAKGCMFVRVHDVKENVRAIRMAEAILQAGSH